MRAKQFCAFLPASPRGSDGSREHPCATVRERGSRKRLALGELPGMVQEDTDRWNMCEYKVFGRFRKNIKQIMTSSHHQTKDSNQAGHRWFDQHVLMMKLIAPTHQVCKRVMQGKGTKTIQDMDNRSCSSSKHSMTKLNIYSIKQVATSTPNKAFVDVLSQSSISVEDSCGVRLELAKGKASASTSLFCSRLADP